MEAKKITKPYPPELRERAVRLVHEHEGAHASRWAAIRSVAERVGCNAETLRLWVRQDERDAGHRGGLTGDERSRLKALEREVQELRQMDIQGIVRGARVKTTVSDKSAACPLDRVNRNFRAPHPNLLWLSDFTYVATWNGFVYVAFVTDTFARRIAGCWRPSATSRRPKPRSATTPCWKNQPWRRASNETVSGKPDGVDAPAPGSIALYR
jgi:transposase-like protein